MQGNEIGQDCGSEWNWSVLSVVVEGIRFLYQVNTSS